MIVTKHENQQAALKVFSSTASIRALAKAQDLTHHDISKIGARLISVSEVIKEEDEKRLDDLLEKRNKIERLLKIAEEQGISLGDLTEGFSTEKIKTDKKVKPKYDFPVARGSR